jgi:hypothetical protein
VVDDVDVGHTQSPLLQMVLCHGSVTACFQAGHVPSVRRHPRSVEAQLSDHLPTGVLAQQ